MKRRTRLFHLALATLFSAGCSVGSLLDKIEAESDEVAELGCSCLPAEQQAQCLDQAGSAFSVFERDCLEDALKKDKKASRETLKCTLDSLKEYHKCLEDKLSCDDPTSLQACAVPTGSECPKLPAEVEAALGACVDLDLQL